ncbi:hypothetical protein AX15_007147 [Amanita polypyramis BW_CC]|nr:hypothetical protein AX15_007147 [Amanita polypyramis BW_CC]
MWAKISSALKPRQNHEDEHISSQGEVLARVFEQHPNLSVFQGQNDRPAPAPSPPGSPSRNGRRSMFRRGFKAQKEDDESLRAPSPLLRRPQTLPKKMMSHFNIQGNGSQTSLGRVSIDARDNHNNKLPSDTARRPVQEIFQVPRPSSDPPKQDLPQTDSFEELPSPSSVDGCALPPGLSDPRLGSVRSILRHPNTPGTGQNVRFFSRDAYRSISPDSSLEPDYQPITPVVPESGKAQNDVELGKDDNEDQGMMASFFGNDPNASGPTSSSTPAAAVVSRSASSSGSHKSRPSLSEVFSPLGDEGQASPGASRSLDGFENNRIRAPDFNSLLDTSEQIDGKLDTSQDDKHGSFSPIPHSTSPHTTSTPFNSQDKGKGKERVSTGSKELLPSEIDEKIFHSKEGSPRLLNPFHDRSHSFSFGQTVFFSANNNNSNSSKGASSSGTGSPLGSIKPPFSDSDSLLRAASPSKGRSRALSDTIFHSRAMSPTGSHPEADINDESFPELILAQAEPDPFNAHANTYYTPQTMIPTTPPQRQHTRRTSKEENIIFSLQAQLTLQTELCGQYETDLRARDEMVEILNNKIAEMDKEENRKKMALRTWKKKVQELEKAVRHLEEELEGSRQESMERSIMDEASGEALRMLHRQIAGHEREKGEWSKMEITLKEEMHKLEGLVKERNGDVTLLRETLQKKDEAEREWQESIRETKEQIDMMGNVSIGYVDEEELRRLAAEREQQKAVELERHRAAETNWQQEKTELSMKLESMELDKGSLAEQMEILRDQMKARDEEYKILKAELEAQWQHMEKASEKLDASEKERMQMEVEKESLKRDLTEIEERAASLEVEWQECENRRNELENELQEVWAEKEVVEKEREQLEGQLQQEREQVDELTNALQERQDYIHESDQERRFAAENVSRLEENLRQRDQDLAEYSARVVEREAEVEKFREELSSLKRGHSRELDEKTRRINETVEEAAEARAQLEEIVRIKAEIEVENKTNKDRITGLKEEVERLRRQFHTLQQDSADKEVKVVQMTKQLAQKEEDITGLNIALDSKQQELELMKRRQGVRGTAGSTPAQPSKLQHRRNSSVSVGTPTLSRPPSVTSDSSGRESVLGKQRKLSSDSTLTSSAIRISTLGKSARVNTGAGPSRAPSRAEGSMGPPLAKSRASISTPTPMSRVSSVSSQASVGKQSITPVPQKRIPSSTLDRSQARTAKVTTAASKGPVSPGNSSVASISETEEKENVSLGKRVPVPA